MLSCPGDDQWEQNDQLETAAIFHLGGEALGGIVCGEDLDHFRFDGDQGCTVQVSLEFDHGDGNLDLVLLDGDGAELAASRSDDDHEQIEFEMNGPGPFYPLVRSRDGLGSNTYTLEIAFDCPEGEGHVVINEIDYDQPGQDTLQFIELFNDGDGAIELGPLVAELVNGENGEVYATIALADAGLSLAQAAYLVVGTQQTLDGIPEGTSSIAIDAGSIQTGPDGLRIRNADTGVVLDSMSYEGRIEGITEGNPAGEDSGDVDVFSLSRCPNGADGNDNETDFAGIASRTPGAANAPCPDQ